MVEPPSFDARLVIHLTLTLVMAGIAIQLFLPTDTYGSGQNWKVIAAVLTEQHLAAICWAVACTGALGLSSTRIPLRMGSLVVLATAHGVMAIAFAYANPAGIGSLLLIGFAGQGYYLVFRRFSGGY